ncbi:MAG: DUF4157 domain-containing protein [Myxococcales bacterium]|nr:DUF4157 domain-containing protein [Myxococcales bacterium]
MGKRRPMQSIAVPGQQEATQTSEPYGALKAEYGAAFGADLGGVNIAHDGKAEAMGAQAYAQGDSIHLAAGKGDPASAEGRALLGHEMAHVVQQRDGRVAAPQAKGGPVVADQGLEAEADVAGAAVAKGEPVPDSARARTSGGGAGGGAQAKAEGAPIQMFGTPEHKTAGDQGSQGLTTDYTWGAAPAADGARAPAAVVLTHGDLTTLSGDFFDPRDTDERGQPIPDSLFKLAGRPSRDPGKQVGTQDELLYALKEHNTGDARFAAGGSWAHYQFSDAVKESVTSRYLRLAARNDEHFQNPRGPGSGGPTSGNRRSGGGSYRELHEDAILRAHKAKADGAPVADAMAHEAAAQHFLTDAFASGHLRTPRASIRSHWQAKYPLFFSNLKKTIAHETAIWLNANHTNLATIAGGVQDITGNILAKVEEATASMPPFGFDDVVSLVVHDTDNERGLWVKNDLGDAWQTFGDNSYSRGETARHTQQAVALGCQDINHAYAIDASDSDEAILAEVRARTPAPAHPDGAKYGPEQAVPVLDPAKASENGTQNWQASSFEELWTKPVRSDDASETFQAVITAGMQPGGELYEQLHGMSEKFPESQAVGWGLAGTLAPRRGFLEGFFNPMAADPYMGLRRIIHYDPSRGQSSNNTDDAVMEDFERMDGKHESLAGLTMEQRISRTRVLLGGSVGSDEAARVVEMFRTCGGRSQARALYEGVEGHAWSGDWIQGWTVDDDNLWNGLSQEQLATVKAILNG